MKGGRGGGQNSIEQSTIDRVDTLWNILESELA